MIYNRDARETFLSPQTVDLFITHPPYFGVNANEYGGNNQIQDTNSFDIFNSRLLDVVKHMEYALKDNGNILLVMPNDIVGPQFASMIPANTSLKIAEMYVWDFQDSHKESDYSPTSLIYRLVKSYDAFTKNEIRHNVLRFPWLTDNLQNLKNFGYVYDAMSEDLVRVLIEEFSDPGDTVADLMAGTGTVAFVSKSMGREFIYNDVSDSQRDVAIQRLSEL